MSPRATRAMARDPPRRPDLQSPLPRCRRLCGASRRSQSRIIPRPARPDMHRPPAAPARTWERRRRSLRTLTRWAEVRSDRTAPGATPRVPPGSHRHDDSDGGGDSPGQAVAPRNNNSTAPALAAPRGQPPRAAVAAQPMAGGGRRGRRELNQWRRRSGGRAGRPVAMGTAGWAERPGQPWGSGPGSGPDGALRGWQGSPLGLTWLQRLGRDSAALEGLQRV